MHIPGSLPEHLIPQLQGGKAPQGGFVRIPVSGPGVGTRETGGEFIHPGEAAWNAIKWKLPLGPAYSEPPTTGTWGTDPGKQLLKHIPVIGRPIAASAYAAENPVQWNPPMSANQRIWETLKNLHGYAGYAGGPAGKALTWASRGIDVAEGVRDLFSPSTPFQDRTGVLQSFRDQPGGPSFAPGGTYYDLPQWSQRAPVSNAPMIQPAAVPSFGGDESLAFGGNMIPASGTNFGSSWDPDAYWNAQAPQAA